MDFEWDEHKRQINIEKHKIDFVDAVRIYGDFAVTTQDTRDDWGEARFVSIGLLFGIEIVVVFTPRDKKRRIISARRARMAERKIYHEEREKHAD